MKTARLLLLLSLPALATTMISLDVPSMAKSADAIVQGTVTSLQPRWTQDHHRIITDVRIEVTEAIKGAPPKTLVVMQPGGVVGDVGQRVAGTAQFEAGEEVVLFLEKRGAERFAIVGMSQGKFRVERSSDGTAAFVIPDPEAEALLVDPVTRQPVSKNSAPMKLDAFKTQIRTAMAAPIEPSTSPVQRGVVR
jgi:hypothetical protein